MPCFSKLLRAKRLDLVILDRQDLRQHLDHGHLGAERAVERGKFDADGAGADDQQRLRDCRRHHGLEISPHQFLVRLEAGQHARPRAGGDDDVLGLIVRPARARPWALRLFEAFTVTLPGASIIASPQITDDLVLLHEEADAVVEAFGHAARALDHGGGVIADIVGFQPIVLGVLHVVINFRRTQQRLGRDAAPVEADAAEIVALDDRRLEAELRRADGGDVAAGPGTDDEDVERGVGHHTTIITGFSISVLNAVMSSAPSAPSMAR